MRSDTTVRDVMHREFLGVNEADGLADAARLMVAEEADCLVVLRGREPVGRLSARGALAALLDDDEEATVGEAMVEAPPTVEANERLATAEELLVSEGASRLVVTADGAVAGVLTERDALAAGTTHAGAREFERPVVAGDGMAEGAMVGDGRGTDSDSGEYDATPSREAADGATQSICETCGSLAPDLSSANGSLVCPDCLEV